MLHKDEMHCPKSTLSKCKIETESAGQTMAALVSNRIPQYVDLLKGRKAERHNPRKVSCRHRVREGI